MQDRALFHHYFVWSSNARGQDNQEVKVAESIVIEMGSGINLARSNRGAATQEICRSPGDLSITDSASHWVILYGPFKIAEELIP